MKKYISWIKKAQIGIENGEIVKVRPKGGSMRGRIESGQLVTLKPITQDEICVNDVVFIKWKSSFLLHLIKKIDGDRVLIGNNLGKVNGWINRSDVLAKVIEVRD